MLNYDSNDILQRRMTDEQSQPFLVIGTPCYGRQVSDIYAASLLKLQLACVQRNIRLLVHMLGSEALITRARQNVVAQFLANGEATHLLFVDADIGFEPEQVFRLLEFDEDAVAAIYPLKRLDWNKIATTASERESLPARSLSYLVRFPDDARVESRGEFAKVKYAGTGFLLLKRQMLLAMLDQYPELRYAHEHRPNDPMDGSPWRYALFNCFVDETGTYLSEDFSFCRRWTDMGGEIWIDLRSRLTHLGAVAFEGDLWTQFSFTQQPDQQDAS
ncbi:MAG TPA: hypothetical protein VH302_09560 [Bryobacteraceae bacterium]|jgi:hypothetical protein|nr:hypothetical protein [Bryobacteraceae bacterium]